MKTALTLVGIINAEIKETGDDLTVDNFLDAPAAALQAEVDQLPHFVEIEDPAVKERLRTFKIGKGETLET